MASGTFQFTAELWRYPGDAAWYFVTLPHDVADDIAELVEMTSERRRGFGSVRVHVTVGTTVWDTSLFPDNAAASYLLPVKKAVRTAEDLVDGEPVEVIVELADERHTGAGGSSR